MRFSESDSETLQGSQNVVDNVLVAVVTIGIAGYTNAGKSSFFLKMSRKEVLVEDKLFSTLETTVGRLAASPRVLLADTTIHRQFTQCNTDAFRATLSEALE